MLLSKGGEADDSGNAWVLSWLMTDVLKEPISFDVIQLSAIKAALAELSGHGTGRGNGEGVGGHRKRRGRSALAGSGSWGGRLLIVDSLLNDDQYLLLVDYQSYIDCQEAVSHAYLDQEHWTRMSILNTARMCYFSSDRSIAEYARDVWHVTPLKFAAPESA